MAESEVPDDATPWYQQPPWSINSPNGVWYYVRNKRSLWQLAKDNGVKPGNFSQLVGLRKNSSSGLPQQKAGWHTPSPPPGKMHR